MTSIRLNVRQKTIELLKLVSFQQQAEIPQMHISLCSI